MMVWERELLSRMITSDLDGGGGVCSTVLLLLVALCWTLFYRILHKGWVEWDIL